MNYSYSYCFWKMPNNVVHNLSKFITFFLFAHFSTFFPLSTFLASLFRPASQSFWIEATNYRNLLSLPLCVTFLCILIDYIFPCICKVSTKQNMNSVKDRYILSLSKVQLLIDLITMLIIIYKNIITIERFPEDRLLRKLYLKTKINDTNELICCRIS